MLSFQVKQAISSGITALIAIAAIWGLDLSVLQEPWVMALITAAAGALGSFFVKHVQREPTLTEAYHVVDKANQAREAERFGQSSSPGSLLNNDGFQRPDR